MGLNLKDEETVALVAEVARRTGRTKTAAVRELAREKLAELDESAAAATGERQQRLREFLEREIWPQTDATAPPSKHEIEELTGMTEPHRS